ncbi:Ras guanine nucleotide exchange factor [Pelomyxa schiedti]|nr:Ras guanine nucleotide exchange factor [Pelomyxa schiedti]
MKSFIERDILHTVTAQDEQTRILHAIQTWVSLVPTDFIIEDPNVLLEQLKWRDRATSLMFSFHKRALLSGNALFLLPPDFVKGVCLWMRCYAECSSHFSEFYMEMKKFVQIPRRHPQWNSFASSIYAQLFKIPPLSVFPEISAAHIFYYSPGENCYIPLLDNMTPTECAWHIMCLQCDLFRQLRPMEMIHLEHYRRNRDKNSPNIIALLRVFNVLSSWVAAYILSKSDVSQRVTAVESVIDLTQTLWDIRDFQSCLAVLIGLNSSSVSRLKHTWEKVSVTASKKLESLKKGTDCLYNYRKLRQAMRTSGSPVIPYIGLYLTDLTFIEEAKTLCQRFHGGTSVPDSITASHSTPWDMQPREQGTRTEGATFRAL